MHRMHHSLDANETVKLPARRIKTYGKSIYHLEITFLSHTRLGYIFLVSEEKNNVTDFHDIHHYNQLLYVDMMYSK